MTATATATKVQSGVASGARPNVTPQAVVTVADVLALFQQYRHAAAIREALAARLEEFLPSDVGGPRHLISSAGGAMIEPPNAEAIAELREELLIGAVKQRDLARTVLGFAVPAAVGCKVGSTRSECTYAQLESAAVASANRSPRSRY